MNAKMLIWKSTITATSTILLVGILSGCQTAQKAVTPQAVLNQPPNTANQAAEPASGASQAANEVSTELQDAPASQILFYDAMLTANETMSATEIARVLDRPRSRAGWRYDGPVFTARFGKNSAVLSEKEKSILDKVAQAIKQAQDQESTILISGHASTEGASTRNDALSQERAEAVRRYLMDRGVPGNRLSCNGFGASLPLIDPDDTEDARAVNRRVEFERLPAGITMTTTSDVKLR